MTQAIILCGGKGTRLSTLYADRPKILVPIAGRPFLEWQLAWLGRAGVADIHFAAGYKSDVLAEWLGSRGRKAEGGSQHGAIEIPACHLPSNTCHVSLSSEPAPLGTGGGLKFVEPWLRSDPFLVLNGDSLSPQLDFAGMIRAHEGGIPAVTDCGYKAPRVPTPPVAGLAEAGIQRSRAPAAPAITIAVSRISESGRYGTVEFDETGIVTAFREKAQRESGWINAGIYLMDRALLDTIPPDRNVSIETDVFPDLVRRGCVRAWPCPPPMLDMGTPDGIRMMEAFLTGEGAPSPL